MDDSKSVERSRSPKFEIIHLLTLEGVECRIAMKQKYLSGRFSCADEPKHFDAEELEWFAREFEVSIDFGQDELSVKLKIVRGTVYAESVVLQVLDVQLNQLAEYSFQKQLLQAPSYVRRARDRVYDKSLTANVKGISFLDDILKLRCEIRYAGAFKSDGVITRRVVDPTPKIDPTLQSDLLKFQNNTEDADVTIIVAGKKFKAHKALLKARSDYFCALYESGMKESRANEVKIGEADPAIFEQFLGFLYTGAPPNPMTTLAWDLLPLANRFGSLALKGMCEAAIVNTLSVANAIKALTLAHAHSCPNLTKESSSLIKANVKQLVASEDWKELKKNPELLAMVVEKFAE